MAWIGLEIESDTGAACTWVSHSKKAFLSRVNSRVRELAHAGSLPEFRHHEDPIKGLEYVASAGREVMVFDVEHAIAHIVSKGAHHWALYEALRDHGLIHAPYVVSWFDVPRAERMRRLLVNETHAEVWNALEAEAMADHHLQNGAHDIVLTDHLMTGEVIRERSPPFHASPIEGP